MCLFKTTYGPVDHDVLDPPPRVTDHTAYYRPDHGHHHHHHHGHHSHHSHHSVARLPPARRSYDYYRSSATSLPSERRYIEYHEPRSSHGSFGYTRTHSPGYEEVRREKVVYRS